MDGYGMDGHGVDGHGMGHLLGEIWSAQQDGARSKEGSKECARLFLKMGTLKVPQRAVIDSLN